MVELTTAMIRDVDHINTGSNTLLGVFRVHNALNHQGDIKLIFDVRDRVPGHRRLIVHPTLVNHGARGHTRLHGHITFHNVALTTRIDLSVCSQTKPYIAAIDSALNLIIQPGSIASKV